MIFKTIAVALLFASLATGAVNAHASDLDPVSRSRRGGTPQIPVPRFPGLPGVDPLPGLPGGAPWDPQIPAPGKHDPKGGPEVPFPLSITLPFPWGAIEGTWRVITDKADLYFSFEIQTDTNNKQYLRVTQFDEEGVVAQGIGISVESDKLVRAAMMSKLTKANYMLFVGSYKNQGAHAMGTDKSLTVLTVRPFTSLSGGDDLQVVVQKISNSGYTSQTTCEF